MITRIVSFKSFYSEEYQKEGDAPKDTILEEELAKWIMENMPGIQAMAGFTAAEKVNKYLHDFPEDFKLACSINVCDDRKGNTLYSSC